MSQPAMMDINVELMHTLETMSSDYFSIDATSINPWITVSSCICDWNVIISVSADVSAPISAVRSAEKMLATVKLLI